MESGHRVAGVGIVDLCLADAQQGFLIAEVDFDVPAVEVMLQDWFGRPRGIGTNEKSRIAIAKARAFARTIGRWSNHHQPQNTLSTGRTPAQLIDNFDAAGMIGAGCRDTSL